jgi:SAM-dependent methyltransferase
MIQPLPIPSIELPAKQRLQDFYNRNAGRRGRYRKLNWYYHRQLLRYLKSIIPENASVLEIGCGDGRLLAELKPSRGVGVDFSAGMIDIARKNAAEKNLGGIEFFEADIEYCRFDETFDYIVLFDTIGNLLDIQAALESIKSACRPQTRIIVCYHSMLWEPLLKLLEALRLKMPQPHHNWLSDLDIRNFMDLCGFDLVKYERRLLVPAYVPLVSALFNKFIATLPLFNRLCVSHLFVLRAAATRAGRDLSATIVVPCRNERGNIAAAIERLPRFGASQEILFVDGHSTDGTLDEIEAVKKKYPEQDIKCFTQPGTGKADAVRFGFEKASGDVLMILDADLTVPPEYLERFYGAIVRGTGELVMGSRLVYPMEKQAMRFLNILGNRIFSLLFSWLLNQKIKDTLCGTKVLLKSDYGKIRQTRDFFGDFDPFGDFELIFGASKQNLKIIEIPIRYRERTYGTTNIDRFAHGWLLLKMCFFALRKLKLK